MSNNNTFLVSVRDTTATRKGAPKEIPVAALAENINVFLTQIDQVLEKAPDEVGKFKFTELSVTAEISGKGSLVIMGTGVETTAKGGITFKFQRK